MVRWHLAVSTHTLGSVRSKWGEGGGGVAGNGSLIIINFICLPFRRSVSVSVCRCSCLSVCHSVVVFVCQSAVLPVSVISSFLYVCLSFRRCICLSFCRFTRLGYFVVLVCLSIIPSMYLSVILPFYPSQLFRRSCMSVYHSVDVFVCHSAVLPASIISSFLSVYHSVVALVYFSIIFVCPSFRRCTRQSCSVILSCRSCSVILSCRSCSVILSCLSTVPPSYLSV